MLKFLMHRRVVMLHTRATNQDVTHGIDGGHSRESGVEIAGLNGSELLEFIFQTTRRIRICVLARLATPARRVRR